MFRHVVVIQSKLPVDGREPATTVRDNQFKLYKFQCRYFDFSQLNQYGEVISLKDVDAMEGDSPEKHLIG